MNTDNKVNNNIMEIMPELKKNDIVLTDTTRLTDVKHLTKSNFFNRKNTHLITKSKNNLKTSILKSNKSMNKFLGSSGNLKRLLQVSTDHLNRTLKKKLSSVYSKEKSEQFKIGTYNNRSNKKINSLPIIMNTLPKNDNNDLDNKEERFNTDYKDNTNNKKQKNSFNAKTLTKYNSKEINNNNNEYSFASSLISESFLNQKKSKSRDKPLKFKNYLDNDNNNMKLINNEGMIKKEHYEQMKLKTYLKNIPDFFGNNKNSKKIFFGMNKKSIYQNNVLFTDFK